MKNPHPPKKASPAALMGVLIVGVLIASALGGLAVGRLSSSRKNQTGPQTRSEPSFSHTIHSMNGQPTLPVLSQLPRDFHLTGHTERPFNLGNLRGKANVVNFIFTSCPTVCPLITRTMLGLQKEFETLPEGRAIQLLSISVDPQKDTPSRLAEYANTYHISADHWLFLTGSRLDIVALIRDGFKLSLSSGIDPSAPIMHSEQFALVDGDGVVRGYYNPQETLGKKTLVRDATNLAAYYMAQPQSYSRSDLN